MSQYVTKIRTDKGDLPVDYNSLANLPDLSRPNLLINSDFRYPVNQRGETNYINNTNWQWCYTVDRWALNGSLNSMSVSVNNGSITVINNSDYAAHFRQWFERKYDNNYYTVTINVVSVTGIVKVYMDEGIKSNALTVGKNVITLSATPEYFNVFLDSDASIELEYIKLEVGNVATQFVPRQYAEEVMLCRRYYRNDAVRLVSYQHTNRYAYFAYNFEPMRDVPTFSYVGFAETLNHAGVVITNTKVSCGTDTLNNRLTIIVNFTENSAIANYYYLVSSGRVILDAEMYQ